MSSREAFHVIAVGGLDPTGGAGLVRDHATALARGASCELVLTAWTEQGTAGVVAIEPRPAGAVADNLERALQRSETRRTAVKVGMVATPAIANVVARVLSVWAGPVVFDPVLHASHGGALFAGNPATDVDALLARADVTTPNWPELALLAGGVEVGDEENRERAVARLRERGAPALLIKGGHAPGGPHGAIDQVTDTLFTAGGSVRWSRPRWPGPSPRGTGCALATALAVERARGRALAEATEAAGAWLHERIGQAHDIGGQRVLP